MEKEKLNRIDGDIVVHSTDIRNNIVQYLNYLHGKQDEYKGLVLWVYDPVYSGIMDEAFINDLKFDLLNKQLDVFADIEVKEGKPDSEIATHVVVEGVEFNVVKKRQFIIEKQKAVIRIVAGRGKLLQNEYILDPRNSNKRKWFIGRGSASSPRYAYRENDIIITPLTDNSLTAEQRACNGRVSSAHAFITYSDNDNCFFFHQDKGGLHCGTVIEKDQVASPIMTDQPIRLSDGCLIKLGGENHHVFLRFNLQSA